MAHLEITHLEIVLMTFSIALGCRAYWQFVEGKE